MILGYNENIMLLTDSYKTSHYKQYPPKTTNVYSYFESRGAPYDICFFGLQYILERYLAGVQVTPDKIRQARDLVNEHMGGDVFNTDGWNYILHNYQGRLPVRIKAVPEGTVVSPHNVLMTIENTDPNCYWLTNYLETLLVQAWYPTTVASQSRAMKQIIQRHADVTSEDTNVDFKLHDFGFRGSTSVESAALGGAAHLLNFRGTDTIAALSLLKQYYGADDVAGFSIPASEHSTMTAWGQDRELDAMRNMLEQYPTGLVACVSDSFDIYQACEKYWGTLLKDRVLARDGILVVRPDSGDPPTVVRKVLTILGKQFGYTVNSKGYKVLNPKVRVIQGDGIDIKMLKEILYHIQVTGQWASENVAFGSGGGLLQKVDRDTCKFAFKCSSVVVDGEKRDVWKKPITDSGKDSKRGRLSLIRSDANFIRRHKDEFITVAENRNKNYDELQTVFLNGAIVRRDSLTAIRKRVTSPPVGV